MILMGENRSIETQLRLSATLLSTNPVQHAVIAVSYHNKWIVVFHRLLAMLKHTSWLFLGAAKCLVVQSCWNLMAHGDARERKWRGKWRMEWVASTLHTTSEHGVSIITTVDAHTSAASSQLNWLPRRLKWTRPFRRKTRSCFCACVSTFQTQSTSVSCVT